MLLRGPPETTEQEVDITYLPKNYDKIRNRCYALLSEHGIASEDAVELVCGINGSSFDTLNAILEYRTGENDVITYFEDELVAEGLAEHDDESEDEEDTDD